MNDLRKYCPYCKTATPPIAVDQRLARCVDCGALLARPRPAPDELPSAATAGLARLAPDNVLCGKYRIVDRLGEGAHGVTYLASHLYLGHPCVVKILPEIPGDSTGGVAARLRDEARAGFRVQDARVVRVLECDTLRGTWYFVMEFVDGLDLAGILRRGLRLPWTQVRDLGLEAFRGLAAIHAAGLVHRDIKPGNLLLGTDGHLRIADLGVARLARERAESHTNGGTNFAGTVDYAAPEVYLAGAEIGPACDVYSLGASLYHLATGRAPHESQHVFRRLVDLQTRPATWPRDVAAPPQFVATILAMLSTEVTDRTIDLATLIYRLSEGDDQLATAADTAEIPSVSDLEPRGVGVLPFYPSQPTAADDWVGYALGNALWRQLTDLPGIYVADQDTLQTMLQRLGVDDPAADPARVLLAGRRVGAGTVVGGTYERTENRLRVQLHAYRAKQRAAELLATLDGTLDALQTLTRRALDETLRALALRPLVQGRIPEPQVVPLRAREHFVRGRRAFQHGDYQSAISEAEAAVGLHTHYAEAIGFMGVCLARLGRYGAAEAQHHAQETLAQEWRDARLEVEALANLGVMNYFRGEYEAAEAQLLRAAEIAARSRLATEHAQVSNNLGFVCLRRGRMREADSAFRAAIKTHRAYGALSSLVGPYNGLGNLLVEEGHYAEARQYYRRALTLAEEIGDRTSVGNTHVHLGRCAAAQEDFAEARHQFTMALAALEETQFWNGLARAYEFIAEMNVRLANLPEALRCTEQRIALARQHSNARIESAAWRQRADVFRRLGHVEEATTCDAEAAARAE